LSTITSRVSTLHQRPLDEHGRRRTGTPLFPSKVVGESLLDRLINNSYQVTTGGTQSCN